MTNPTPEQNHRLRMIEVAMGVLDWIGMARNPDADELELRDAALKFLRSARSSDGPQIAQGSDTRVEALRSMQRR